MILDFQSLASLPLPPVVIIGSGPAGLTLAQALSDQGIGSLLLEAGEDDYTFEAQDLYQGEVIGDPYYELDQTRLMQFGGSGNHWGGFCRPLDAHDFLSRDDIPHMGWPITKADLDPYAARTDEILGIGAMSERRLSQNLNEVQFALSEKLSFSEAYFPFLSTSTSTSVSFRSRVTHLDMGEDRRARIHVRETGGDGAITLSPRMVVLATGGIENSRLLLWSNTFSGDPVVRDTTALGRYWMEHPHMQAGQARTEGFEPAFDNSYYRGRSFLAPTQDAMRGFSILNGAARLREAVFGPDISVLERHAKEFSCRMQEASSIVDKIITAPEVCTRSITVASEQAPNPDNKVTLSANRRDAHDVPLSILHWRKSEVDRRTIKVIFELLGRYLVSTGQGLARAERWTIEGFDEPDAGELGGHHHMGGTRMGNTSSTSVVDANLKVHGTSNLFVAGSSIFPTGGHANPTYTIIQLSLRLADFVKSEL